MLMNVGPMGDGSIHLIGAAMLDVMGTWVSYYEEAIRTPRLANILLEIQTIISFCSGATAIICSVLACP